MGRPRPPLLPFGSSRGLAHVTAAAVAELGNLSGDAGRGRVHSRGSQSEARVVEKEKNKDSADRRQWGERDGQVWPAPWCGSGQAVSETLGLKLQTPGGTASSLASDVPVVKELQLLT